jgi:PAS domain S-box-containing protein
MRDDQKTKAELLQELDSLRGRVSELKQAKEKLHKSEQRYRSLTDDVLDSSKVGIFILDDSFKVVWLNQALERYFGLRRKDVIGKDKRQLILKQIKDIFEEPETFVEKVFATYDNNTYIENFECHVLADGQRENRWLERWSQPIRTGLFAGGRIEHYADITERKEAEQALAESEEKFRSIFDNANDIIGSVTKTGKILEVNKKIEDILGYKPDELVGKNILTSGILAKKNAATIVKLFKKSVKRGRLLDIRDGRNVTEVWVNHKDGHAVLLEASSTTIKEGGKLVGYLSVIRDIRERKKAEEALRQSEEKFRNLAEKSPNMIFINKAGRIVYANQKCQEIMGYNQQEFYSVDFDFLSLIAPDDTDIARSSFSIHMNGEDVPPREYGLITKQGERIEALVATKLIQYDGQNAILGIVTDITERKKWGEDLRKREELHELFFSQSLDGFFYMMFDEPIRWDDTVNKEKVLDYVFAHHRITKVNDAMLQQYGASQEQFIGLTPNDLYAHDIAYGRNVWRDFLDAGRLHLETDERKLDGTPIWIDGDYICLYDSQGRITGHFGIQREITEEKRAREALRESEKKYRALVEQSLQGIIILQDFQIIFANPTAAKIAGLTVEEVLTLSPEDIKAFIPIEERAAILQRYEECLADKPIEHNYKLRLVRKNGDEFWLDVFVSQIEYLGKSAIQVAFIDITERKRAEEAYRSLVDHSLQGLAIFQNGRVVFANQAMADITGYTVEEMLTSPPEQVQAFVHPDDHELLWSRHRDRLNGKELPERYEFRGIRKDGSICWLEIHASRIEFQGKLAIQAAYVDITERKKAEEALQESENKYRTLLENLPQKIFLKDNNSVYVSCNDNFAKDLKIRSEEFTGKTDYDFFPKALADKYRADDKRIIESGQTEAFEEKYIEDGEERIVHTVKTPFKDKQGNVTGVLGIFWDITEPKRREEELNIYREKMVQAEQLASVGTLSATLAHELTQPLTVLSLSIENSLAELEKTSCPDTVVEDLKEDLSEITIMTSMINRFRNFAKMSLKSTVSKVDLKAVAERIVELLDESAWRAKVTLQVEGMDKLPPIYSCARELEQLFFSLIENAIQAADGKKSRQVIISSVVKDEHIELQLSDNCGGIAPENLDRIFEPFFTTKPAGERTGLGLCVAERIVNRAGGKIRVESKLGKGSIFFVTLPINKDEE